MKASVANVLYKNHHFYVHGTPNKRLINSLISLLESRHKKAKQLKSGLVHEEKAGGLGATIVMLRNQSRDFYRNTN